jgi:glutamate formiminotransferase / formiminotetrahydrofolate cyclodeaminase
MKQIVECVPNFSEGRDQSIIKSITDSIEKVNGAKLLNVEPDKDYNRVVVTLAGEPAHVLEGAFQAMKTASHMIDMRKHHGEHPRMGATDVVPFVPISNITMEECVQLANQFGERAGRELGVPMYLYANAARKPVRSKLPNIRKGEYEGLGEKLKDPEWKPDFGPDRYNETVARCGATATGARFFLIAYNINLATNNVEIADEIAFRIRESGRPKKDANGNTMKDTQGKVLRIPGSLKETQAKGILMEAHNITQVSMNLLNYLVTSMHSAFEECKKEAAALGTSVTGSEVVGLLPKDCLLLSGKYYAEKKALSLSNETDIIQCAIDSLGLSQLAAFDPKKKIIDFMI